jgi:uncharacterized cofD-like protein
LKSLIKLLHPGMKIKRWFALLVVALTILTLGIAYLLVQIYRTEPFPEWVAYVTLQFLDRPIRGALFILAGGGLAAFAFFQINRSLLSPFTSANRNGIVDALYQHRSRHRGPRIVAIGGGTGLSNLIRGLREHSGNITAIVTVADDGGSSGHLRREMGILPPGDFRRCIGALSDVEPLMTRLFEYRFKEVEGLSGHSFGNLFIVAMTGVTGNFEKALQESSRVLAVRGQVVPSTLENIALGAEFEDGSVVKGETAIRNANGSIRRIILEPSRPPAYPKALKAILEADIVVVGPGSLYTSVMPNLLVEDIARSISTTKAARVYVCNVAMEQGETEQFCVADHIRALEKNVGTGLFDYVLVNRDFDVSKSDLPIESLVRLGENGTSKLLDYTLIKADVIDPIDPIHHDPHRLARAIMRIYDDRDNGSRNGHDRERTMESVGAQRA